MKFLGGEDDNRPELNSVQLAERHAAEVNESAAPGQFLLPLIHKLPSARPRNPSNLSTGRLTFSDFVLCLYSEGMIRATWSNHRDDPD